MTVEEPQIQYEHIEAKESGSYLLALHEKGSSDSYLATQAILSLRRERTGTVEIKVRHPGAQGRTQTEPEEIKKQTAYPGAKEGGLGKPTYLAIWERAASGYSQPTHSSRRNTPSRGCGRLLE